MKLHFHGHACWEIEDGDTRVLIDPFLTDNPVAKTGPDDFERLDAIIATHGHFDHIADVEAIAKKTGAPVISNYEIATHFGAKGCANHPMHIGGGHSFDFGHVKFTVAHHGSTGPGGESLGNPMGVVLTLGGRKVYHAGDTGLFSDMKLIAEMYGPLDVAILPIGDNFTMGVEDAVKASEFLDARVVLPMHYDTFELIAVDAEGFARRVREQDRRAEVVEPGGSFTLD